MKITIEELEAYLYKLYGNRPNIDETSLFMKLVEEMGEIAELLNKRSGRKAVDADDLEVELGKELADLIHYAFAIAAICFCWASIFYFCQYFIAKRPWQVLIGAILEAIGSLIMITNFILANIGVI